MKILLPLFCLLPLMAQESISNNIHQTYIATRAMGMGNAFTAVSDDHNVLFYNPAGLAMLKRGHIDVKVVEGGLTTGDSSFLTLMDDIDKASSSGTDLEKTTNTTQVIEKNYGNDYYARVSAANIIWTRKSWGIGVIPLDLTVNLGLNRQLGPTLNINATQDSTFAFGIGRKLKKVKGLALGVTLKGMYRLYFGRSLPAVELATGSDIINDSDGQEGFTIDADLGALYDIPLNSFFKPRLSFVIRNAFDYGFSTNMNLLSDSSTQAPDLERRFDVGSQFTFGKLWGFRPMVTADIRDMGHSNWTLRKGMHLGTELKWDLSYWLNAAVRFGMNQGYATAGASLKLPFILVDLATYGEEMGTKDVQKENRIAMGRVSLNF